MVKTFQIRATRMRYVAFNRPKSRSSWKCCDVSRNNNNNNNNSSSITTVTEYIVLKRKKSRRDESTERATLGRISSRPRCRPIGPDL